MRLKSVLIFILSLWLVATPAQAQGTFSNGAYEFESVSIGTSGAWTLSTTQGSSSLQTTTVGGYATFYAVGNSLIFSRLMRITGTSTMQVCIGATCGSYSNSNASQTSAAWHQIVLPLAAGTNTVTITNTAGTLNLDYFMVLSDPSSSFPTSVPTATILPSSTPASTATPASTTTPQPTPTPQPTSTPAPTVTPLSYVWALDPSRRYGSTNGQISAFDYSATAADTHIVNLLTTLLISVWGFFFFAVFVLGRRKS